MKRAFVIGVTVVALGAAAIVHAQSPRNAEVQMKAAQQKAEVEGDLRGAIQAYTKVVAAAGSNRALAARALLRVAECHQKLGNAAESRAAYARVARDFADVPDAVSEARRHVDGVKAAVDRDLPTRWSGADVNTEGTISRDGRYLSYSDPKTGDLAIRDLVAGTSRRLTAAPGDFTDWAEFSAISRDGRQVAYAWFADKTKRYELRVLPIDATPQTTPRTMTDNPELSAVYPYDWSPDGRWIAVRVSRPDRTAQIGLVAARDLSLTVLKSVDWRGSTKMFFSPDGRYLAYDLPVGESSQQRDVFVIGVDGAREVAAVAHTSYDVVMGWSTDGRSLLFASNRTGAMGLWTVPMADGKATGAAVLVRPNIGPVNASLGVTRDGALVLGFKTSGPNIFTAAIDPSTGKLVAPAKPLVDGYLQANRQPSWSRDGKSIAYLSHRAMGPSKGTGFLVIQSLETGRTTELQPLLSWFLNPTFAPDGSVTVGGSDLKGRRGIFRVDPEKGGVSEIVVSPTGTCTNGYSWSPDGTFLVYKLGCNPRQVIIVKDMRSGEARELVRAGQIGVPRVSPDGRLIAYVSRDAATRTNTLAVVPMEGGTSKEIMRVTEPAILADRIEWTADGRRLVVSRREAGKLTLQAVSLDGGAPSPYDAPWPMTVHPDGRRVVFSEGENAFEVRSVEIASPGAAGKR